MDDQELVAENIRALMGRHEVGQDTIGAIIGVSRSQVSDRLHCKVNISVREVAKIARYFHKEPGDLFVYGYKQTGSFHQPPLMAAVNS
jgi:transcriptional regulator with XRE-family HTH domain